jgi:Tol biopolymer transport system component
LTTSHRLVSCFVTALALAACAPPSPAKKAPLGYLPRPTTSAEPLWLPFTVRAGTPVAADPREHHLTELRQLTFEGDHGRARFSPDGRLLLFESRREDDRCTQLYSMDLESGRLSRISTGVGSATLGSYVYPRGERLVYASSEASPDAREVCSTRSEATFGVWPHDPFKLLTARVDGSEPHPLFAGAGQAAQAFVAPDGSRIGFTSTRDGNPELYTANLDGTDLVRVTHSAGYDGEGAFSTDGSTVVWSSDSSISSSLNPRASAPTSDPAEQVWEPPRRELMVAGERGQRPRFVTDHGKRNVSPYFIPGSPRVIFASDMDSAPGGQNFELYVVDTATPSNGPPECERITYFEGFDGIAAFSSDGSHVVFASSRHGKAPELANLFIARWVE